MRLATFDRALPGLGDVDSIRLVVVNCTLLRRCGPKVLAAYWTHDGSAQDPNALGRLRIEECVVRMPGPPVALS